jgi:tetratricopeptide (TPR) repeat protein
MNFNLPQTKLRISLLVLFCSGLFAHPVFAQKQKIIDSLMLAIKSSKDTALVDVYNEISYEYKNIDIEKTLLYADTAIIKSKKINYTRGLGYAYANRGNYFKSTGDNAQARACYVWAYIQHQKIGNLKGIAATLNSLASLHFLQGKLTKALSNFIQSLTISRKINDPRGEAITLNNIGVINQEQKNYSKALEYFEQSYHTFKEIGDKKSMADALNNIGNIYHILGINDDALRHYNEALATYISSGDIKGESSAINNIGLVLYEAKDYKSALKYYHQSLSIDEMLNDKQAQTITCNNIAYCYYNLSMFFAAKKYVLRALKSAQEQEDKIDMVNSYDLLAKLEDKLGNYKEALTYFKLYTACSDSLYSEETRQKLEDIEAQYEAEKAENERLIKVLGKDQDVESVGKYTGYGILANTRMIIMMSIAGILLLTGILFWIKRR